MSNIMKNVLIIDSRIMNLDNILSAIKYGVKFIILDYYNDTFNSLIAKLNNLNIQSIESIGLLRHGYYFPTYLFLHKQDTPSIIYNVNNLDPDLNTWIEIKNFLFYLVNRYNIKNFDFLSCRLDKFPEYSFVFDILEKQIGINIRATENDLGQLNWSLTADGENVNIKDIYFTDEIFSYPYLFFMPVLSIKSDSYSKSYDGILFTNPSFTYDGFVDGDTAETVITGSITYSGTYITAINVGIYTIIPFGLNSTKYYLDFVTGYLEIIPTPLVITINNYIKIYNGLSDYPNYVVNYTGLIEDEDFSSFSGSLVLNGDFLTAINVGEYNIIPSGLTSTNYNITYTNSKFTIIPASLLIVANNYNKIYNGQEFIGGNNVTYDGFVNGENESVLTGSLIYSGDSQGAIYTGTYTIIPSGLYSNNYDITFINGLLYIYNQDFLIQADNYTKFYDKQLFTTPTVSYSQSFDLSGVLDFSGTFITALDISSYTILPFGYYSNDYNLYYYQGTLNIVKTNIYVVANDYIKTYDALPFDNNGYYLDGLQGTDTSDSFVGDMINIGTSYMAIGVGIYTIIPSNIFSYNYNIIYVEGTLTVNKAPLYLITQLYTKVYDAYDTIHNDEMQSNIVVSISGIINGESISLVSYFARFRNVNAGYQSIDISFVTLSGFTLNNYYLVSPPPTLGLILPRPVNVNFDGRSGNKPYDGLRTIFKPLLYSISGILGYENVSVSSYFAQFRTEKVGPNIIDISYVILWGPTANNYSVNPVLPVPSVIFQNFLKIYFKGGDKIYDSFYDAGPLTYTISGTADGDDLTISSLVAKFRVNGVGLQVFDISNIILWGNNSYLYIPPAIPPMQAFISPRFITATFRDGNKFYDGTTRTMNIIGSLSGFYGFDEISISSFVSFYRNPNPNIGSYIIDISAVLIKGGPSPNYRLTPVFPIFSRILIKPLFVNFFGGNKVYDDTEVIFKNLITHTISGYVPTEYHELNYYDGKFKNGNAGIQTIDISNVVIVGENRSNYYIEAIQPFQAIIYPKELTLRFTGGSKLYDGFRNTGFVNSSIISGVLTGQVITISSFTSLFQSPNSGLGLIDISNIILSGIKANNYFIKPVMPISATIFRRNIVATFSGGDKLFDNTFITGPLTFSICGLILNDFVTISSFTSRFIDGHAGLRLITISNIILTGPSIINYILNPVYGIFANIYQKKIFITFSGGEKEYDGTQNVYSNINYSISGLVPFDFIILNYYTALFKDKNVGYQLIDISSIVLQGINANDYYFDDVPSFGSFIYKRNLYVTFTGGSKIYDGTFIPSRLTSSITNGVINETFTITNFNPVFRNRNVGIQIIDISDVTVSGVTINNYIVNNVLPINATISRRLFDLKFFGGDKMYDKTNNTGPITFTISGLVAGDFITVSSFVSFFKNVDSGLQFIDISNIILFGPINNYFYNPIQSFLANISKRNLFIYFSGGEKIYDGNTVVLTPLNYSLSGIVSNDIFFLNFYIAAFRNQNAGIQIIDIANVTLIGSNVNNYNLIYSPFFYSQIFLRALTVVFSGGVKQYDGTNVVNTLNYIINNIVNNESIIVSNYNAVFKNSNVGLQYIDISNITLSGSTINNYYFLPIPSLLSNITFRMLKANFYGGSKIYDTTTVPSNTLTGYLTNIVPNENINIVSYISSFDNPNFGLRRIDISNLVINGSTINNYLVEPIQSISANIFQKQINVIFSGGNKYYDGTDSVGPLTYYIEGVLGNQFVTLNYYEARFRNITTGIQYIDFFNIVINQPIENNYFVGPVMSISATILNRNVFITFTGGNKIYNGLRDTGPIVGTITNLLDNITISSFTAIFKSKNSGFQLIDISDVILSGDNAEKYVVEPIPPIRAFISRAPIEINFTANDKIYDRTDITVNVNGTISGLLLNDIVNINSFNSRYRNRNAGSVFIDVSNIILSGIDANNYFILPVKPIISNILPKPMQFIYSGGSKIYDGTLITGTITYTTSGIIDGDFIDINLYTSSFREPYVGNQIIDVNILAIGGSPPFSNYSPNLISSFISNIDRRPLTIVFSNKNKIYDGTNIIYNLIPNISNIVTGETINVIDVSGYYSDVNVGTVSLIINSVTISSITSNNYYVLPVVTSTANILPRLITINFTGGDKIYDKTRFTGTISGNLINVVLGEIINIVSLVSRYKNVNVGYQFIDISNVVLSGLTVNNYRLASPQAILGLISPKSVDASFNGVNKIYDNMVNASVNNPRIFGIIDDDIVTITSYNSNFTNPYVGNNKTIIVNNITTSNPNYIIGNQPVIAYANVVPRLVYVNAFANNKVYDQNNIATLNTITLSGIFFNDISFVSISSYISTFSDIFFGINKIVNINNIVLTGSLAFNYFTGNNISIGSILRKQLFGSVDSIAKVFNGLSNANVTNFILYGIINPDIVTISSFVSLYDNPNVGTSKNILVNNIRLTNNNYYIDFITTSGSIIYPTSLNLALSNNELLYKDISGLITISLNSIWEKQETYLTEEFTDIYNNIITTANGNIYNNLILINTVPFRINSMFMLDNNNGFIVSNNGYVFSTNNSWITISSSLISNNHLQSVKIRNNIGFIVGLSGSIYKSTDLVNWNQIVTIYNNDFYDISIVDNNNVFIVGSKILIRTSNGGNTWTRTTFTFDIYSIFMFSLLIGYVVGSDGNIFRTTNGANWISSDSITINTLRYVYMNNLNEIIVIGDSGTILISFNRGLNWTNYVSGVVNKLNKANVLSISNIKVIGSNGTLLNFLQNIAGKVIMSNLLNIDISQNNPIIYYRTNNLNVGNYNLNASFIPNNIINYSSFISSSQLLTIRPILFYPINSLSLFYDRTISNFSVSPFVDQSGGVFSIFIQNNRISIDITSGIITFNPSINVGIYNILVTYVLNNVSTNTNYILTVIPNYFYSVNNITLVYKNSGFSVLPYVNQPNGVFTLDTLSGLVSISNSGRINFNNNLPIGSYSINPRYTLNAVSNTANYTFNVIPIINYTPNFINIDYSNIGFSNRPFVDQSGGNFDLSLNSVLIGSIGVNNQGIIIFNNTIPVGFYSIMINYTFNNQTNFFYYNLNYAPYFSYSDTFIVIEYDHIDISSVPIVIPTGGIFSISGPILNRIIFDSFTGSIRFNNFINVDTYDFLITYRYNGAFKTIPYELIVIPNFYYSVSEITVVYNTNGSSIVPFVNPTGGYFTITELDNILVQSNFVSVNYYTGIISIVGGVYIGIYNFTVTYTVNNIDADFIFTIRVIPAITYTVNNRNIVFDTSGSSIVPTYSPLGGAFSISGLFDLNRITINTNTGVLFFGLRNNVGMYTITVRYILNNLSNTTQYILYSIPSIRYNINETVLLYQRTISTFSIIPSYQQRNGFFNIVSNDLSSNLNYVNSNVVNIDISTGIIEFKPLINVGLYTFRVFYTLNNQTNFTNYNLNIRPNIFLQTPYVLLEYDRLGNYTISSPIVDQSGGLFSLFDISGKIVSINMASINNRTGIITLLPFINVGYYNLLVRYTLNSTFNNTNQNIVISPVVRYVPNDIFINYGLTINSVVPYFNQQGGTFNINDLSGNTVLLGRVVINLFNGIISFANTIDVGIYNYIITYTLNSVSVYTTYQFTVKPIFNYIIFLTTLPYNTAGQSELPTIINPNGVFTIFDISNNFVTNNLVYIDSQTGRIFFSAGINVGINYFRVTYTLNNSFNTFVYQLNITPTLVYTQSTSTILYDRSESAYSVSPIYQQINGFFRIIDNIGNLVETNLVTINTISGIIEFKRFINVGQYSFIVTYSLNNLSTTVIYNLVVIPNIEYSVPISISNYGRAFYSVGPYYNQLNGEFSLIDISGSLFNNGLVSINQFGVIYFSNLIFVGYYSFRVRYALNNTSNSMIYQLYIVPNISYSVPFRNLNYGFGGVSVGPLVSPINGRFSLLDLSGDAVSLSSIIVNPLNGIITFTNKINVGLYYFRVTYTLNGLSNFTIYNTNVFPYINYNPSFQRVLYNSIDYRYSAIPTLEQMGGTFTVSDLSSNLIANNSVTSDSSGALYFKNLIPINTYSFIVTYTLRNISSSTIFTLQIIPNISFNPQIVTLTYGSSFYSPYPYYDQSGGTFTFSDISGLLITNNLITYDISFGSFYIPDNIDVGLYNISINYTFNGITNNASYPIYVLPIVFYNINQLTMIYNTFALSLEAFRVQLGGSFSIDNPVLGVSINTLSGGILYFSNDTYVGFYDLIIRYTLNGVSNTTNYYLTVLPVVAYSIPYLLSEYYSSATSPPAIYDPAGGQFTVAATRSDISNYDISSSLISVNNNGEIYFASNIEVGIYNLVVYYYINNVFNSTKYVFTKKPYFIYPIGFINIPYLDVSFTEMPEVLPTGGKFIGSVPSIDLIYTGISVNLNTGVIRFGRVNAGSWNITIKYTVNGVTNAVTYSAYIIANVHYNPPYSVIPYNSVANTQPPYAEIPGGTYSTINTIPGISINTNTGALFFSNLNSGIYYLPVTYTFTTGDFIVIQYTLLVKPIIVYTPNNMSTFYTNAVVSSVPYIQPTGGIYSATFDDLNYSPLVSSILIDISTGVITATNTLFVATYNLAVSYTYNASVNTVPFTIYVYPNFSYPIGIASIINSFFGYSELPIVNPRRGFYSSPSNFFVDPSNGIIQFKNTTAVAIYNIPIYYTYNGMRVLYNYSLTVYPYVNYPSVLNIIYGSMYSSDYPNTNNTTGVFNIISISGTFKLSYLISYIASEDQFLNYGLVMNGYSGKLNYANNILVGEYNIRISYTVNNLTSFTDLQTFIRPYINYPFYDLTLDYNTAYISARPIVDQSGGYFGFSSSNVNINFARITINNNTGIITFARGIDCGLYNIIITYTLNQVSNNFIYKLTVRPIYYYSIATKTIIYNVFDTSIAPTTIQPGGTFSIIDYNNIDPLNITINNNGIIQFGRIDVGSYNLVLQYSINSSNTTTNFSLIVKPFINYSVGITILKYSFSGDSEIPTVDQVGGVYSLEDLTSLGVQFSKVSIDSMTGRLTFGSLINVGLFSIVIGYTLNGIMNTFTYQLQIIPYITFIYTVSGQALVYNNYTTSQSTIPEINPTQGLFYFSDFSNNYPLNISLNRTTGIMTFINPIPVNSYNIGIKYYVQNSVNVVQYYLTILPKFYYINNVISITYSIGSTNSNSAIIDPSGGIVSINLPIDMNLVGNISVNRRNGILTINNLTPVGTYEFGLSYTLNNTVSLSTFTLNINPSLSYSENTLYLLFGNDGNSSKPFANPRGGTFTANMIGLSGLLSRISVDSVTGIIYIVGGLIGGIYGITINYIFNGRSVSYDYYIQVSSGLYYTNDYTIMTVNTEIYSEAPNITLLNGKFSIPNLLNSKDIFIDASSGILRFTPSIKVDNYTIPVSYLQSDILQTTPYYLTVKPDFIYDISAINMYYNNIYVSKKPIVNPPNGLFTINGGLIDLSGRITIIYPDAGFSNIVISYTFNNITTFKNMPLYVYPNIYYSPNIQTIDYGFINSSVIPVTEPEFGTFALINDISNIYIDYYTGIINFDNVNLGKYNILIGYTFNGLTSIVNYRLIVNPYFTYPVNFTDLTGGREEYSVYPITNPIGGIFSSNNLPNGSILDTISGVFFFRFNIAVNIYNINVKYSIGDISSNTIYTLTVYPFIYYPPTVMNYNTSVYSSYPFVNVYGGLFYLTFNPFINININAISIDASNGLILFDTGINVGRYIFYVNYLKGTLYYQFTYSLMVRPTIGYNNYNMNASETAIIYPTFSEPPGGNYFSYDINRFGEINNLFGYITVRRNGPVGDFIIPVTYIVNGISGSTQFHLSIFSVFKYPSFTTLIFGYAGTSVSPIISVSGGIFDYSYIPGNGTIHPITGVISFPNTINVGIYNFELYYIINGISTTAPFILTVIPDIYYEYDTTLVYGSTAETEEPYVNPLNGVFSLVSIIEGVTINTLTGKLTFANTIDTGLYNITVKYTYNNISNNIDYILNVTTRTINVNFLPIDKVYDGTSKVIMKSNKLAGVFGNDKVFIESYKANFISPDIGINVPIVVFDIFLGGPKANNYDLFYDGLAFGNIYLARYEPNISIINFGTSGSSTEPIISEIVVLPQFLLSISGPLTDAIDINPYGVIYWDSTVPVGIYSLTVTVYNDTTSFNINYTLEVTFNLYGQELITIPPNINNSYITSNTYKLQYNSETGFAYVQDTNILGMIAKMEISVYDQDEDMLVHDIGEPKIFTFYLPNADPSNNIVTYEYNDNGTINYDLEYPLKYIGGSYWETKLKYLSDYIFNDLDVQTNVPPIFNPQPGLYFSKITLFITALPNSIIYYTTDGSTPTVLSNVFNPANGIRILKSGTYVFKAFSVTPGYSNSSVVTAIYNIMLEPCILEGSLIKTPKSYTTIDDLKVGDIVITGDGRKVPIEYILKFTITEPEEKDYPCCIPANYFGQNIPSRPTYISCNHAIKYGSNWLYAAQNPNMFNKLYSKTITYYHIELPNYFTDDLVVNNLVVESWLNPSTIKKFNSKFYLTYPSFTEFVNGKKITLNKRIKNR